MFIALSFVGILPCYIVECVYQIRLFNTTIPIYIIINNTESVYLQQIQQYNVTIVDYETVKSSEITTVINNNFDKFEIVYGLIGREEIFIRSFERFFLLQNTMKKYDLTHGLFMEIDNLLYDDPTHWLTSFQESDLAYMFDNVGRCSSGIMYVKSAESIQGFLDFISKSIETHTSGNLLNEMTVLYDYYLLEKNTQTKKIQLLPVLFEPAEHSNTQTELGHLETTNYNKYNNTIFDAAAIGIYLFGTDPFHTNGKIILGRKNMSSLINYSNYKITWKTDDDQRKIPYIYHAKTNTWLKINNLHIHSKLLHNGLSIHPINPQTNEPQNKELQISTHIHTYHENVVIVPSIIETPNSPLSYSKTRSIYSKRERFSQTKRTLKTIREKIPNAFIVVIECSNLTDKEHETFTEMSDIFLNLYYNGNDEIVKKIHSKSKSMGEGTMTIQALNLIHSQNIKYDRLFKLSGRYWLNEHFDYSRYLQENAYARFTDNRINALTILYKLTYEQTQKWLDYLLNANHHFTYCIGYENIFSMFLRDVLERDNGETIIDMENMGAAGYISVCGTYAII